MITYKYNEEELIDELKTYVDSTYEQHYSQNKFQATEFIIDGGHGEGFCLGNILKYSQRYGKKAGKNRNDLLKVLHYALIALHVHDKEHEVTEVIKPSGTTLTLETASPSRTVNEVMIMKCHDSLKWYAGKVGRTVRVLAEYDDEYKALDDHGYTNFISKEDALPV
jgi:hypothetical protein